MSGDSRLKVEVEDDEAPENQTTKSSIREKKSSKRKQDSSFMVDDHDCCVTAEDRRYKRITLLLTKPSYSLAGGSENLRTKNRSRLRHLLQQLVRQRNWRDAAGVLAVLLKGTCKDNCPSASRFKYTVLMELYKNLGSKVFDMPENTEKSDEIYGIWMRKIGISLSKNCKRSESRKQDIFAVRLESIVSRLMQRCIDYDAGSIMQEHEFTNHPIFNTIVGMILYEIWYDSIPEDMKWKYLKQIDSPSHSENSATSLSENSATSLKSYMSGKRISDGIGDSEGHNAVYGHQSASHYYSSETSVMNDKKISANANNILKRALVPEETDVNLQRCFTEDFQPKGLYVVSDEDQAFDDDFDNFQSVASMSFLRGLDPWLLPLQTENWELDRIIYDGKYNNAVDCLRKAVCSTPPVIAAILPLMQLFLIRGKQPEALNELEKLCSRSVTALPFRLMAYLWEQIDPNNSSGISACLEDSLKTDPTCKYSLERLVGLHKRGDYGPESLLEMIALHLDAVFSGYDIWRELALCFLKVLHSEEDRLSICFSKNEDQKIEPYSVHYNKLPKMFMDGKQGKAWRLRCRWWSRRHFSQRMLASEIADGDLELVTYKAACAYHMYGHQSEYFLRAYNCLEEGNNRKLAFCLRDHMKNSIGLPLCDQRSQ